MSNNKFKELISLIPHAPDYVICWNKIESSCVSVFVEKMKNVSQDPYWHSEGDVWTHTKLVCEVLASDDDFQSLEQRKQQILFIAALLHDVGKFSCTRMEDGKWISPWHCKKGAQIARDFLWRTLGLCGTKEDQSFRECVCNLIRYHMQPVHLIDDPEVERKLIKIASQGELIPDFSLSMLRILVRADLKGRICDSIQMSLDNSELCFSLADELGILDTPEYFSSDLTKRYYLKGKSVWRKQDLYDGTWGEVIMMSGLPGTGKDTWISEKYPLLPVISLDKLREELNISPEGSQGKVINLAREQAKDFLRKKQPFIWNATCLTEDIRRHQIELFEQYNASVKVVFLETSWKDNLERNSKRPDEVPEKIIEKMLRSLEPPERFECVAVEWICV